MANGGDTDGGGSPRIYEGLELDQSRSSFARKSSKEDLHSASTQTSPPQALPAVPTTSRMGNPLPPVSMNSTPDAANPRPPVRLLSYESGHDVNHRAVSGGSGNWELESEQEHGHSSAYGESMPVTQSIPYRQRLTREAPDTLQRPQAAILSSMSGRELGPPAAVTHSRNTSGGSLENTRRPSDSNWPLQYQEPESGKVVPLVGRRPSRPDFQTSVSGESLSLSASHNVPSNQHLAPTRNSMFGANLPRPASTYSSSSEFGNRARSPQLSPSHYARASSANSGQSDSRPVSYVDLLNVPYPQPPPAPSNLENAQLREAVGTNASLLSTRKTLDMYRANVKKTNDPTIQYEFAVFMINAAKEAGAAGEGDSTPRHPSPASSRELDGAPDLGPASSSAELLREARHILQRLSDRSYPFAQYYLADGYASGLFRKGKEDYDRAFPLFIAASKHGHAEAGYRAALCYEFGWGTRKDPPKAVQFYRQSASKNHPGAMSRLGRACLFGEMGLGKRYREGIKWLKRAAESADYQYNSAPYELGILHETGYGDDVFRDESYAAQLFTQSADLGHVDANYRLGDAYEHGKLSCPRDPALSVHFYTGAAQRGHPLAMMALCAWYMVGAEPVLEKDENEAYEWARKAAETGIRSSVFPSMTPCHNLLTTSKNHRSQKQSTPSATLQKRASAAGATRSRPTSGMYELQTTETRGQNIESRPLELRRVEAGTTLRARRLLAMGKKKRTRRKGRSGGFSDCIILWNWVTRGLGVSRLGYWVLIALRRVRFLEPHYRPLNFFNWLCSVLFFGSVKARIGGILSFHPGVCFHFVFRDREGADSRLWEKASPHWVERGEGGLGFFFWHQHV